MPGPYWNYSGMASIGPNKAQWDYTGMAQAILVYTDSTVSIQRLSWIFVCFLYSFGIKS